MQTDVKIYPLVSDIMFKHIFGYQKNARFTIDLLESFYGLASGTLKDIVITNSVKLDRETVLNKKFETDIEIKFNNGEYVNLEMYQKYDRNSEIKSLMYISGNFSNELKVSENYNMTKKYVQLNFVKKNYVHKSNKLVKKYLLVEESDNLDRMLPELFQIYIINLDYEGKIRYNYGVNKRFIKWIQLMNAEDLGELESISQGDKVMEEVVEEMKLFSGKKHIQNYHAQEVLIRSQHESELKEADLRGQAIGQEETTLEIAKGMLRDNVDLNIIKKYTNLSISKLEELKEEVA